MSATHDGIPLTVVKTLELKTWNGITDVKKGKTSSMQANNYAVLGTSPGGETLFMDIAGFADETAARAHAIWLLDQHRSNRVEIWRSGLMIDSVPDLARVHNPADLVD